MTWRATTIPKKAPPSPTRKSKTTTSPATKPKSASKPSPKLTSAPSLEHILVLATSPSNEHTSDIRVGSTTPPISSSTPFGTRGDSVAHSRSTTRRSITQLAASSTIPSPIVSAVLGDAQLPRFDPFQMNSSGGALQRPIFRQNDARNPLLHSLIDLSTRRPKHGATSSPAQSVVRGTSSGNR